MKQSIFEQTEWKGLMFRWVGMNMIAGTLDPTSVSFIVMSWSFLVTFLSVHLLLQVMDQNVHVLFVCISLEKLLTSLTTFYQLLARSMFTGTFCCNYFKRIPATHTHTHTHTHTQEEVVSGKRSHKRLLVLSFYVIGKSALWEYRAGHRPGRGGRDFWNKVCG